MEKKRKAPRSASASLGRSECLGLFTVWVGVDGVTGKLVTSITWRDVPTAHRKNIFAIVRKSLTELERGLWGFAYGQGVIMEQKDAAMVTEVFRNAYPEIAGTGYNGAPEGIWVRLENAVYDVMRGEDTKRRVGPNGCILIDKLNLKGRRPLLRIHLPSGRKLHYLDAYLDEYTPMPWTDKKTGHQAVGLALHYSQENDKGIWTDVHTHGGKEFENVVQGIARDILAAKLLKFERADIPVVGHVHDEGIAVVRNDPFSPGLPEMIDIMSEEESWAPRLLLGADGFEGSFYHK